MAQDKYSCPLCEWKGKTLKELGKHIYHAHEKMEEDLPDFIKAMYKNSMEEQVDLMRGIHRQLKTLNETMSSIAEDVRRINNSRRRY
jgi:hypothetical protein